MIRLPLVNTRGAVGALERKVIKGRDSVWKEFGLSTDFLGSKFSRFEAESFSRYYQPIKAVAELYHQKCFAADHRAFLHRKSFKSDRDIVEI